MPIRFTKKLIAAEGFESAAVFDVNGDGIPDIVSGAFWYEGPDFTLRHVIGSVQRVEEYYDDFSTIPLMSTTMGTLISLRVAGGAIPYGGVKTPA